jgi:hypothetical protein
MMGDPHQDVWLMFCRVPPRLNAWQRRMTGSQLNLSTACPAPKQPEKRCGMHQPYTYNQHLVCYLSLVMINAAATDVNSTAWLVDRKHCNTGRQYAADGPR